MKRKIILAALLSLISTFTIFSQTTTGSGAWSVTYTIGDTTRSFLFTSLNDGTGMFRFRTPAATVRAVFPAVWARPTPVRMSFTSEVQLPVSNSLVETGTLVFKGLRGNDGRMTGSVIYIVDNSIAATPTPFTIRTGTFTAVPLTATTAGKAEPSDQLK